MSELKEPASTNQPLEEGAEIIIEGGTISGASFEYDKKVEFHEEQHRADTARRLAYWLVIILGGSILAHYITTLVLEIYGKRDAVESLSQIFNSWLPVISGLVGGATTYYFTREK
jgi:hypothetical protein